MKKGTYRPIYVHLWDEDTFYKLPTSAKYLYFYLYTNTSTTQLGIYDLSERKLDYDRFKLAEMIPDLEQLQSAGYIYYSIQPEKLEITVKHLLLNYGGKGGAQLKSLLEKEARMLERKRIEQLADYLLPDQAENLHTTAINFLAQYCTNNIDTTILCPQTEVVSKSKNKNSKVVSNNIVTDESSNQTKTLETLSSGQPPTSDNGLGGLQQFFEAWNGQRYTSDTDFQQVTNLQSYFDLALNAYSMDDIISTVQTIDDQAYFRKCFENGKPVTVKWFLENIKEIKGGKYRN